MAWTRGPTIGRGSTAAVSLATTRGGDLFAVKSTDLASSASLRKEECFISRLSSPHIIRCLGSDVTSDDDRLVYNLFLEYSDGGSLSDLIRKQGGSLEEESIRFHTQQLLLGVEYLHRHGLVHCDIKAQNILIGGDGLKIADFGCAKWAESCEEAFSGTPAYMAPEVARGEEQSFPADIWAVGCTVVEMATGSHPWPEMKDPASALYRIAFSGDVPEFPSWFSGDARDFLGKCLVRDADKRWTAAELLQHPFLLEISCGVREFTRRSPTSMMDKGFWDAVEESESCENIPTEMESSDSPWRRIGALVGNADPWFGEAEQEWVTVRAEQFEDLNQDFGDLIEAEQYVSMVEQGIAPSNLVIVEDSWFLFSNGSHTNCTSPVAYTHQSVQHFIMYSRISVLKIMLNVIISSSRSNVLTTFFTFNSLSFFSLRLLFFFCLLYSKKLALIMMIIVKNDMILTNTTHYTRKSHTIRLIRKFSYHK